MLVHPCVETALYLSSKVGPHTHVLIHPNADLLRNAIYCLKNCAETGIVSAESEVAVTTCEDSPKSSLDAANIILKPVALCGILLANGDTSPLDAHDSNAVDVVLVKLKLQL
jgi:hypothetical protein